MCLKFSQHLGQAQVQFLFVDSLIKRVEARRSNKFISNGFNPFRIEIVKPFTGKGFRIPLEQVIALFKEGYFDTVQMNIQMKQEVFGIRL